MALIVFAIAISVALVFLVKLTTKGISSVLLVGVKLLILGSASVIQNFVVAYGVIVDGARVIEDIVVADIV